MAILSGIMSNLDKTAGDWTFYNRKGKTVAKQKNRKPATPTRTFDTQKRRSTIANVASFWGCTHSLLKYTMELKNESETEYNEFTALNLNSSKVYLTKEERILRTCILNNYIVSYGTLPGIIDVAEQGDKVVSSLCLGDLVIDADTTVLDLTIALQANNPYFQLGDRVIFYRGTQVPAQGSVQPTVDFYGKGFTLRADDETKQLKIREQGFADGFESVAVTEGGVTRQYLGCQKKNNSMVAWCRSRFVWNKAQNKSRVMCTTQRLFGTNSLLEDYTSKMALYRAIKSHGGVNREDFANPDYVDYKAFELEMEQEMQGGGGTTGGGPGVVGQVTVTCTVTGGHGTVSPASHTVSFGSSIQFTAAPDEGYEPCWPDQSHGLTYTLQATQSKDITLTFRLKQSGGGGGNGLGSRTDQ